MRNCVDKCENCDYQRCIQFGYLFCNDNDDDDEESEAIV